ncbi:L-idonate 5-dehydrogenase [Lichenicola cladoniae]|uniref:L-idonate 5-dehydrogenase n=1 Tax=Lichenicola cladoniae TaxID=1484109 RepID=A0A6M8HPQ3_9PROT|nr:L-idonate 5-dehydrogenase [Lichenicola cladoniae]NPD69692.1 L-idonate 5-dehydrogenase [Acetobacteraceae bacterium]QKE90394.1 L-idonate 5-dehydrogenase [Lichenicola cladoniae]
MFAAVLHGAHDLRVEHRDDRALLPGEARVRVACGGICGSDLSYFNKGGVGDFRIREPLTLGHEVSGTVIELAPQADLPARAGVSVGTRVAINPSRPCLQCRYCREGRGNLCRNMRFLGSAALMPHVQGGFSENVVVRSDQCVPVPDSMSYRVAACAEPLAVALHAVSRAGTMVGRQVLIAGAGPIGLLCLAASLHAGAAGVTITDLCDPPLQVARAMGAASTINILADPEGLDREARQQDGFDIAIEATGAAASVSQLPLLVRPGGRIVQLGMLPPGAVPLPVNLLMAREIDMVGSFRFHDAFDIAVAALSSGRIDIIPILSASFPLRDAPEAFVLAADRQRAIKVHLDIT